MRRLGSVQQKMPCAFLTEVRDEPSRKREWQQFQVVASERVNPVALDSNVDAALATEKVDGTCCYVSSYKGEPYLWARLDRKPNKQADKRFRRFQHFHQSNKGFSWNIEDDFKNVPEEWLPAHGVQQVNGNPVPDENGHILGWVPVEKYNQQYRWHSSVVDYEDGLALVLRPHPENEDMIEITSRPLSELLEQTLELIGTNINGNPYGLGDKKHPLHVLVPHGIFQIRKAPSLHYQQIYEWFQQSDEGRVEGIVWHCADGTLVKLHRHHLNLKWPVGDTFLNTRPVVVHVDWSGDHLCDSSKNLFHAFSKLNGQQFGCLRDVHFES
ncbi:RNA ligase 1 [Denticeps clupeoides]|uniref:RNA ligase 1 n=1 Tax=Denticeps clupeoides TaxID=299321 RepID=A0AAY4CFH4_9TELE|nr:uncharacterized protein C12orf29 homolog [Denticeps clupeoides]